MPELPLRLESDNFFFGFKCYRLVMQTEMLTTDVFYSDRLNLKQSNNGEASQFFLEMLLAALLRTPSISLMEQQKFH